MFDSVPFFQTRAGAALFQCYRSFAAARLFRDGPESLKNFLRNG